MYIGYYYIFKYLLISNQNVILNLDFYFFS